MKVMETFRSLTIAEKIQLSISILMQLTLLGAIVWSALEGRWWVMFVSAVAFVATTVPIIYLRRRYELFLPIEFQLAMVAFLYASLFLGEVGGYYDRFWWWDMMLHGGSGFALGFVGFLVLYILHRNGRLDVSPFLFALFTFCFALTMGALWEIIEFGIDTVFSTNMQRQETGGVDTMIDLMIDATGALAASFLGYEYIRRAKQGRQSPGLYRYLITRFVDQNRSLLRDPRQQ